MAQRRDRAFWAVLAAFAAVEAALLLCMAWDMGRLFGPTLLPDVGAGSAADQQMARMSMWTVVIGAVQLAVSAAGILYLALTLSETRRALAVQGKWSRQQNRAYVHAEKAELEWRGASEYSVQFTFTNSGQTPATYFEFGAEWFEVRRGLVVAQPFPKAYAFKRWSAIGGAGDSKTARWQCPQELQVRLLETALAGASADTVILLLGKVRYETIYGETYSTEFAFFINRASSQSLSTDAQASGGRQKLSRSTNPAKTFELIDAGPDA